MKLMILSPGTNRLHFGTDFEPDLDHVPFFHLKAFWTFNVIIYNDVDECSGLFFIQIRFLNAVAHP